MRWRSSWRRDWRRDWRGQNTDLSIIPPYGPAGVGTFVLDLENGFTVTQKWFTDVQKTRSGREPFRNPRNDRPQQSYSGSAFLLGDVPRNIRARLARHAALGSAFLLALPHEALELTADASGSTVYVETTSLSDWPNPGQRCVLVQIDDDGETTSLDVVIQQDNDANLVLDQSPGSMGATGGLIMPTVPVFLEPQQNFPRYPVNAEAWQIVCRAAIFDFAPALASLALDEFTVSAAFDGVVVRAKRFGLKPIKFRLALDVLGPDTGTLEEADVGTEFHVSFAFKNDVTTLGDLANALAGGSYCLLDGTYNPSDTIAAADDSGGVYLTLTGAGAAGEVGRGAELETYDGDGTERPVWDRELAVETTATDSLQAMTQIIDHDGIPYSLGTADESDWGRAIAFNGDSPDDWQWLKLFLSEVKGRAESFWLPTWRPDMDFVSVVGSQMTVEVEDLAAWYPTRREHIQIRYADGTVLRTKITASVNNGDGTYTLTLNDAPDADVEMISWLELVRWEGDDFSFDFQEDKRPGVAFTSRVSYAADSTSLPNILDVVVGANTYYLTTADRDLDIGGVVYTATAMDRNEIVLPVPGKENALEVTLPIDHPIIKRYFQFGIPPRKVTVTLRQVEADDSLTTLWVGDVTSVSVDSENTSATMRIPAFAIETMQRTLPTITCGRACPHLLYDGMCQISRTGSSPAAVPYQLTTTVLYVNGIDVRVDLSNVPAGDAFRADWTVNGELLHVASGERMTIRSQSDQSPDFSTVTVLSLQMPIGELKTGDTVVIQAGCAHDIATCVGKFDNRQRFAGFNRLPEKNIFLLYTNRLKRVTTGEI